MYVQFKPYEIFLITKWKISSIEHVLLNPENCVGDLNLYKISMQNLNFV